MDIRSLILHRHGGRDINWRAGREKAVQEAGRLQERAGDARSCKTEPAGACIPSLPQEAFAL